MPLSDGTRLGPYEILGPLGAGGMGEVYRARDTRLDRSVAIKVIPAHLAAEAEVRQRFEREARAVSALNHPNICVLHDVGHEGATHFFVMEYLDGESLATRLEKGPLTPDEFFPIAIQIADALAAAHRAGIVHRDLKPGNIVLTRGGAKLLDFGLARATGLAPAPGSGLTQSPTLSRPLTAEGTIVGTFQYMAPEQLEGKEADVRTDIFAFGAMLYEMVTGKRAFEGSSQASLIASIIKETPRPMGEIVPLTPPALEHVVRGCLAKNPDDRWQNAADVKHQLEWIRSAGSQAGVPAPVAVHRRRTMALAWTIAAAAVLASGLLGVRMTTNRPAPPEVVRFQVAPPPGETFDASQTSCAIAPDGKTLAFASFDSTGIQRLWVRRLSSATATVVPNTEGALQPAWSPDSRHIAFFADAKLKRVALADGSVQVVADAREPRGMSWGRNGDIVFQREAGGALFHVRATGGEVRAVTEVDTSAGEDAHRFPCFLPDGNHFLFVVLPRRGQGFDIRVGSLDGPASPPIIQAGSATVYARPGYLLYARDRQLVAHPFDARNLKITGEPLVFGEPPGPEAGWSGAPSASVSENGVLARASESIANYDVNWFDRKGKAFGKLPVAEGAWGGGAFSPDGSRYVLTAWESDGDGNLWMVDLKRGVPTRFTFASGENFRPSWSPDGKNVLFVSNREGREKLFIKPANSATEEKMLIDSGALFTKTESWSPDGQWIVYSTLTKETAADIWICRADGTDARQLIATRFNEREAVVSPDGKWMMYISNESGRHEVYARSFPDMGEKYRLSDDKIGVSDIPTIYWSGWRRDGREVVFTGADTHSVVAVEIDLASGFHAGKPHVLFRTPLNTASGDMSPDGQTFLVASPSSGGAPLAHTVVLNWPELLKQH